MVTILLWLQMTAKKSTLIWCMNVQCHDIVIRFMKGVYIIIKNFGAKLLAMYTISFSSCNEQVMQITGMPFEVYRMYRNHQALLDLVESLQLYTSEQSSPLYTSTQILHAAMISYHNCMRIHVSKLVYKQSPLLLKERAPRSA